MAGEVITLTDSTGREVWQIKQNKSMNLIGTLLNADKSPISKSSLLTFQLTLYEEVTKSSINNRLNQSVLDSNGGVVNGDGSFIIRLDPDDAPIVGTVEEGKFEIHIARLDWSWNDGVSVRFDGAEAKFRVCRTLSVT